jgi:hypothetical protein
VFVSADAQLFSFVEAALAAFLMFRFAATRCFLVVIFFAGSLLLGGALAIYHRAAIWVQNLAGHV